MLKAVFFDAAGTLFHLPRGVGFHYAAVAGRHGCRLEAAAIDAAFRRAWKQALPPPETREPRPDDDRGWWKALAGKVLAECGAPGLIERCFDDLWLEFVQPGVWELYLEVRDVLKALSGRFRLGVISNFDGRLRPILEGLGVAGYFEQVTVSSEAGAEKPSRHLFDVALGKMGIAADEAIHAGDEPEADWMGARAAGLRVFELRRPENSLRELAAAVGA